MEAIKEYIHIEVQELIDLFLEEGIVPNEKFHYRWDEFSKWQIDSLKELGMKPEHRLLDIGCGPLRFGIQAINYLNDGNYFGIDAFDKYIRLAPKVYNLAGLKKSFKVILNNKFEFEILGNDFDFAIAQSVFTHLSLRQITECMNNLKKVMKPGSTFLFSNIITKQARGFLYSGYLPMIAGTQCTNEFYEKIAIDLNIKFEPNVISHPTQYAHKFIF